MAFALGEQRNKEAKEKTNDGLDFLHK